MNLALLASLALSVAPGQGVDAPSSGLVVDVSSSRSPAAISDKVERAVRQFAKNAAALTSRQRQELARRGLYNTSIPFSLPMRVTLTGLPPGRVTAKGAGSEINLVFDTTGTRQFPASYKQLLIDTFTQAKTTIVTIFGPPSQGGDVHVRNFDADIGDRDAVVGGYYVHDNGSGEREIRFPVYTAPEAAGVNFVHTLLLAYLGAKDYGFDAFTEGLVRASVMRIVRTAGAMPVSMDQEVIETVLDNTYDVGTFYDWFNQRALGGNKFIAPNLRDAPLPIGGSLGGVYLARYQMAGSAWAKVLVQHGGFATSFNQAFYGTPGIRGNVPALVTLAADTLFVLGHTEIEGLTFQEWFKRQHILETRDTLGQKLLVQPIPLPPIGGSNDFGVFLVQATWFETRAGGTEVLLGGTSYPIFWTTNFDRVFPSSQEDVMPIAGAYGSVAPNLPDLFGGQPYRASIDIPVSDKIARNYVPAGGVSTGANTTPNDFYGTVLGVPTGTGVTIRVRVSIGATVFDNIPVTNGAFGALINQPIYTNQARLRVEVIRTAAAVDTVMIDRMVNKGPGPLALDLRVNNGEAEFAPLGGLQKGLSLIGLPLDPWAKTGGELLGIAEGVVLAARYNSARAAYDIYPNTGMFTIGNGFFARMDAANSVFTIPGKTHPMTPVAVALRPGWNLISPPIMEIVPTSNITVVKAAEFPKDYVDAAGVELGTTFFSFTPGANDPATGAPETGTLDAATQFEPGKGYFVRVLVPEGATLLFEPNAIAGRARAPKSVPTPPPVPDWKIGLQLEDGPFKSKSFLGQSRTATSGYDRREDSGLPLGMGGFQLSIEGPETMYQDMRRTGQAATWRIKASGLIAHKQYMLRINYLTGAPRVTFIDQAAGIGGFLTGSFHYRFRATAATRVFEIRKGA